MVITVKLFGNLRDYLPEKTTVCSAEAADGSTVGDVLDRFGVPRDKPRIILVNSYRSRLEHVLEDGDVVAAFQVLPGG
jgi:molybdopterin converting factor small subunit